MEIVHGIRLWWIILSLCVALLLSSLESTIVATALVSIGSDFKDYERSNWVVVSYLVTYSSFLIIFARLSDITGRKAALLTGLTIFTLASVACGLARTLNQLIIFRAFQGVGGSGIYSIGMVVSTEITPVKHFGFVSGLLGGVFATASAVGPLIGGAISSRTTWRWCFYLNVPTGALLILLIILIFPGSQKSGNNFISSVKRIDWVGCLLCLAASIILVVPLEEGGNQLPWKSPAIIAMFVVAALCWVAFASWEAHLAYRKELHILPIVPVDVAAHRVIGACIITALLTGISFTGTIIFLPQRFQVANDFSPIKAGAHILPLLLSSAMAWTLVGVAIRKKNNCAWLILAGNSLQLLGLGLHSSLRGSGNIQAAEYGYQVILGLGLGITLNASFILARIEVKRKDIAPTAGAISQLRVFGGVLGVAISRVVLATYVDNNLSSVVSAADLRQITASVATIKYLPASQETEVRRVFGEGFSLQNRVLMYIAAANLAISFLTIRRHPKPLRDTDEDAVEDGKNQNDQKNDLEMEVKDVDSREEAK